MGNLIPTIIVSAIIAVIFVAIVYSEIRKRQKGQGSCSCGGSCSTCGAGCHGSSAAQKKKR